MIRPLSPVERAFWLLDRATSFNGVNTSFFRGPIRAAHIEQALRWVQARHPLLRVGICAEPASFVAVEAPLPLRTVSRTSREKWREVERHEINTRYDENQLLWRAVFIEGDDESELVISHQHVIADAQSAVIMARDIAHALAAAVSGRALPPPASLPLRPSLSTLLQPTLATGERLRSMNWFFFRNLLGHKILPARKLPLDEHADAAQRSLGIVHLSLDHSETEQLVQKCKAERTSVQANLCAALLLAAAESLHLDKSTWLACFSAVSLRDRVQIREEMGLYTSQVTTYHKLTQRADRFRLAREIKRDLTRTIAWGEQLVTIPMIGMFIPRGKNPGEKFARRFDLASPATVGLSNIGRAELPGDLGPIRFDSFHMAVGPSVVAPLAACAATCHGRLSMNLVYVEPLISQARAQALVDGVRRLITATSDPLLIGMAQQM